MYYQLHQANVCVVCDGFISGIFDIDWIAKRTLLQHESRHNCYQVSNTDLHEFLFSSRASVKIDER